MSAHRVLIVQADRLGAGNMRAAVFDVFQDAEVVVARSGTEATSALEAKPCELAILSLAAADLVWMDELPAILDLLGSTPALAISGRHAPRTFRLLNTLRVVSIFDPVTEGPMDLRLAMVEVVEGRRYMSPSVREAMNDSSEIRTEHILSPTQERVLSVIGEGCDEQEAAERLSMLPATLATHRRDIMHRLGLHNRGGLAQYAIKHGYVTRTLDGSLRPGLIAILSRVRWGDLRPSEKGKPR